MLQFWTSLMLMHDGCHCRLSPYHVNVVCNGIKDIPHGVCMYMHSCPCRRTRQHGGDGGGGTEVVEVVAQRWWWHGQQVGDMPRGDSVAWSTVGQEGCRAHRRGP